MASRLYKQFLYTTNANMVFLEGSFQIGASGAITPIPGTTGTVGTGGLNVAKTGTGQYQIQLQDQFYRFLDFQAIPISPTSAAGITTDGGLTIGKPYQIVFASTSTNWLTLGVPNGVQASQGVPFVATSGASNGPVGSSGVTAAGNGTVIPIITSGVASIEVLPNPNSIMAYSKIPQPSTGGGYIMFQTLNTSGAAASPTSGTVLRWNATVRNSSLLGTNETSSNY